MIKFSYFPFRIFLEVLPVTKIPKTNVPKQNQKTNHMGGLLDAGRDLNKEFVMPTTTKKKKTKQRQEGELIN